MMNNEEFKRLLVDGTNRITESDLERIIEDEMSKDPSEADFDLVDICAELLDSRNGKIMSEAMQANIIEKNTQKKHYSKRRLVRILFAAAFVLCTIAGVISVTANIIDFGSSDNTSFRNGDLTIQFDGKQRIGAQALPNTEFIAELKAIGCVSPMLPAAMLDGSPEIVSSEANSINVVFSVEEQECSARINIFDLKDSDEFSLPVHFPDAKIISVDTVAEISIYTLEQRSLYCVTYFDGSSYYLFSLPLSLEQTETFVKTIT